jgi:hypothetical protein
MVARVATVLGIDTGITQKCLDEGDNPTNE